MQSYTVIPGVNVNDRIRAEAKPGRPLRLTKALVKRIVADHPEWDWKIVGGPYVNVNEAVAHGLTLEIRMTAYSNLVAVVYTDGGKAVVR